MVLSTTNCPEVVKNKNNKFGLKGDENDYILPCKYNFIFTTASGKIVAISKNMLEIYSKDCQLISSKPILLCDAKQKETRQLVKKENLLGVQSSNGRTILPTRFTEIVVTSFEIFAKTANSTIECYDGYGNLLNTIE